jgi:flagellar export protein FliJ
MRNFRFRLQAVLEQRERQEQAAQVTFAESEAALRRGEQLLVELREVREAILQELSGEQGEKRFDPMLNRLYQDYLQTVGQGIRDQEKYVRDLTLTREAQKLHLIGATQGRQALVSVRDRAKQAHTIHVQRTEQNAMDELATTRHHFRRYGERE